MFAKSTAGVQARRRAALGVMLASGSLSAGGCGSSSHSQSATAAGESPVVGTQAAGTKTLVQTTPAGSSNAARTADAGGRPFGEAQI